MPGLPSEVNPEGPAHGLYEGIEYKEFWNGTQRRNLDALEHALVRKLLPDSGYRIIDVGCGYGRLATCYMDRFQQVIMVDGSMSLLRQAYQETGGQAIYVASDVRHLPFRTASIDAALMIRVFHHIDDSWTCLSELQRVLCNNGRLVFNYCNKQNAHRVLEWMVGIRSANPFTTEPDNVGSTFISHHPKAVHGMLNRAGFSDMQYYGAGVLDRLAGKSGLRESWIGAAKRLAPFFAWSKIAPWILCRAFARENTSLINGKGICDLLQCPACGGDLTDDTQGYVCLMCKTYYPIEDGIIDLRV